MSTGCADRLIHLFLSSFPHLHRVTNTEQALGGTKKTQSVTSSYSSASGETRSSNDDAHVPEASTRHTCAGKRCLWLGQEGWCHRGANISDRPSEITRWEGAPRQKHVPWKGLACSQLRMGWVEGMTGSEQLEMRQQGKQARVWWNTLKFH